MGKSSGYFSLSALLRIIPLQIIHASLSPVRKNGWKKVCVKRDASKPAGNYLRSERGKGIVYRLGDLPWNRFTRHFALDRLGWKSEAESFADFEPYLEIPAIDNGQSESARRHRVQLWRFIFMKGHLDAGNALPAEKFIDVA